MTDKEQKGVEKETNTPDAEAPENAAKTTETELGENLEEGKPEQRRKDAEGSESSTRSAVAGDGKDGPKPEREKKRSHFHIFTSLFQIFIGLAQIIVAIATIYTVLFAKATLEEMQKERDNAYRPEIVIVPNSFEGKILKEDELEIGRDYLFLDYNAESPGAFCSREYLTYEPKYTDTCICLEKPYLTLKNIGQGTAKDIEVTFSSAWFESAADSLTYVIDAFSERRKWNDYEFIANINNYNEEESVSITYTDEEGNRGYITSGMSSREAIPKVNITYIASGEDSVNVALPEPFYDVLAIFYYLPCQRLRSSTLGGILQPVELPDLVITIKYSDMQGKTYPPEEITIPWTGSYKYIKVYESSGWEPETMEIETSFFDNYSR